MCFFFCGVQLFARKRPSGQASMLTVNAARPGLAAISGKAAGTRTLVAPISGMPCYVYRAAVWQLDTEGKSEWKNVAGETGHVTFLIEDETGEILVEPSGAEFELCQSLSGEYGSPSSSSSSVPEAVANFLARNGITLDRPTRVEEYCLQPETPVVVTGTVTENSALSENAVAPVSAESPRNMEQAAGAARSAASGVDDLRQRQPEVIRLASGPVPQSTTQMTQQAKIAAALARAGLASPEMWTASEGSLQAINALIDSHSRPNQSQPDSKPDTSATPELSLTTMTMTKGADDAAFIISNLQPARENSLGWQSVALVLAGSTLTTLSLYVLLLAHMH
jgi:E3 Ubiquitin ligase